MHTSFIQNTAQAVAELNAEAWEAWRGYCIICSTPDTIGFCDRCTECAIGSVWENECEYGGTTESIQSYLMVDDCDKYPRIMEAVAILSIKLQSDIWRNITRLKGGE